ncbi:MAG: hypothetical protein IH599_01935 [Bacteroidales bacterium]|nr:hypothetical protein [Bacteroidales bacterium]
MRSSFLFFVSVLCGTFLANAQSAALSDPAEIRSKANDWLLGFLSEEDTRELMSEHPQAKGTFTWDIVIAAQGAVTSKASFGKARIQTVFMAESNINDHNFAGKFKDLLKAKVFDWKMRKGEQVKVRFTFEI